MLGIRYSFYPFDKEKGVAREIGRGERASKLVYLDKEQEEKE